MVLERNRFTSKEAEEIIKKYWELENAFYAAKVEFAYAVIKAHESKDLDDHVESVIAHSEFNRIRDKFSKHCDWMNELGIAL